MKFQQKNMLKPILAKHLVKFLHLYFAIFTLVATGCKSLSNVGSHNYNILDVTWTKDDFKRLNGTYSNSFDTIVVEIMGHNPYNALIDKQHISALNQLFLCIPEKVSRDENGEWIDLKEKFIKIEFNSKKQATISMFHNDKCIFSKNIHGKFKNGYFYLRPKIYVIPLIPLVFGYNFERSRIGKTLYDDLIIDFTVNSWRGALMAGSPAVERGTTSSIYKFFITPQHE